MGAVTFVKTREAAQLLASHLLDARRTHPVVVVSHGVGRGDEPWIDAEQVAAGVGDYAEVHVVPTGEVTWALSSSLPPETQVYGDAARVYSTDLTWVSRPRSSRLYLCFGPDQGARIEALLEADAMQAALEVGLLERRAVQRRTVTGRVVGVLAGRGIVEGDFGRAALREELAVPGVPIERVVRPGQEVTGEWVTADGLLDVRNQVRPASEALEHYAPGDAVLVRVADVGRDRAVVEPYPGLRIEIGVSGITGNPLDDPRDLMTVGEVVVAHVVRAEKWLLSLVDVDDDEPVREVPALLPGGPAWLVVEAESMPAHVPVPPWSPPQVDAAEMTVPALVDDADAPVVRAPLGATTESPRPARPSPLDLDPRRRKTGDGARTVQPSPMVVDPVATPASVKELHLERAARADIQRKAEALRHEMAQLVSRLGRLEQERDRAVADVERKRTETRELRKKLQRSRPASRSDSGSEGRFVDAESAFRHDVYLAWVEVIPAAEKAQRPLPDDWTLGPDFLASLASVDGVARSKVAEVVVHVLTGLADSMPGRDMHRLRMGPGGDDPWVERHPGEYCWRVALQQHTPSARRLHFWRRGTQVQLSRVALHDEMRP
ncbi:hypothetical protein GCM10008944_30140 [Cytobacillus oceanisediminis]